MIRNGWKILFHQLFANELERLRLETDRLREANPHNYVHHPVVKLYAKLTDIIENEVPNDPGHPSFLQGKTLGADYQHWRRKKFGRYRLFFRFDTQEKVIIYAWLNDENTLRKAGSKNDPYQLFKSMLNRGNPPDNLRALMNSSEEAI